MIGDSFVLTATILREGDQYAAVCQELDVATCGDTVDDACANLDDAITLYLNAIEANGTRERVFRDKGIVVLRGPIRNPGRSPSAPLPWIPC